MIVKTQVRSCSSLFWSNNLLYVAVVFLVSLSFNISFFFLSVSGPAVIVHSCYGVLAYGLSVCLFVCFLAKLIK